MKKQLAELKSALKDAVAQHYTRLIQTHSDIYGYALYTSDGVHSIGPVANRTSAIPVDSDDTMCDYYRYGAVEWSEWDDYGLFDEVNRIISALHVDDDIEFVTKRDAVLQQALGALTELESDGLFGPRSDRRFVITCVADSDHPIIRSF